MKKWDVIVLGLGGAGSSVLYHLARQGLTVLGLDQYPEAHQFGSSHGQTRIVRQAYFEGPFYVPLLKRAYELWADLNSIASRELFIKCGVLQIGAPDGVVVPGVLSSSKLHDLPIEILSPKEIHNRWSGIYCPEDSIGAFESNAGLVHVEEVVRIHLSLAKQHGAVVRHLTTVRGWDESSTGVCLDLGSEKVFASQLVFSAGPWSNSVLGDKVTSSMKILKKHLYWFESRHRGLRLDHQMPCFFHETSDGYFYGFPEIDEQGVKLAMHSGGQEISEPSQRDHETVDKGEEFEPCLSYASRFVPGVTSRLKRHQVCYYSMTGDENFLLGRPNVDSRVVVVAGLSGHGFKFTPVIGEIAAKLVIGQSVPFDLGPFAVNRFDL